VAAGLSLVALRPAEAASTTASQLAALFEHTCLRHSGDVAGLRRELAGGAYQPVSDPQAMMARPGRAYAVKDSPGHLMVLSFDDGWCGDGGMDVSPQPLTNALIEAARRHGQHMQMMSVAPDAHEQRYLLTGAPPADPLVLLVLLHPQGKAFQASLFAFPMPRAGSEPEDAPP